MSSEKKLDIETERRLYELARQGDDDAKMRLIASMEGLFVLRVQELPERFRSHPTYDREDILQEMRLRALHVIDAGKWTPGGMRFYNFVLNDISFRIPEKLEMQDELGSFRTSAEMRDKTNGRYKRRVVSLDAPLRYDPSESLGSTVASPEESPVQTPPDVSHVLDGMKDIDKLVIEYSFGLGDSPKLNADDLAQELGLNPRQTRNRLRHALYKARERHGIPPVPVKPRKKKPKGDEK